jgi:hypothetical protein
LGLVGLERLIRLRMNSGYWYCLGEDRDYET